MLWTISRRRLLPLEHSFPRLGKCSSSVVHHIRPLSTHDAGSGELSSPTTTQKITTWTPAIISYDSSLSNYDTRRENTEFKLPRSELPPSRTPENNGIDRGVTIDRRGQLSVTSDDIAARECRTALILSRGSRNLSKADFTILLPKTGRADEGGLEGMYIFSISFPTLAWLGNYYKR
jgi:hypothetical protein